MKDVDVRADERVAGLALIARWPVDLTIAMLYPLTVHVGAPSDTMGARCWPSAEQLSLNGIYLLENGFEIILYVGERAPIDSLQLLFETDRMDEEIAAVRCAASFSFDPPLFSYTTSFSKSEHIPLTSLPSIISSQQAIDFRPNDNPFSKRVHDAVEFMRWHRGSTLPVRVISHHGSLTRRFMRNLVEDRIGSSVSYIEFLCHVHKQVQTRMSSNSRR
jgi:protein transport protein SEC24